MEIYKELNTAASKEFEKLLNSKLSKNKIVIAVIKDCRKMNLRKCLNKFFVFTTFFSLIE